MSPAATILACHPPIPGDLLTLLAGSPAATLILAAMLLASLAGLYAMPALIERSLFRPHWLVPRREYATLVTSGFMHADLQHLLFNAFTFFAFAFQLEPAMGTPRFVALYAAGLLASDALTYVRHRDNPGYQSLGASGGDLGGAVRLDRLLPDLGDLHLPDPLPDPGAAVRRGLSRLLPVGCSAGAGPHQPRCALRRRGGRAGVRGADGRAGLGSCLEFSVRLRWHRTCMGEAVLSQSRQAPLPFMARP
jgi:hypothetical protein